jgi:arabinose-5-phosphate isomerase
MGKSGIIAQKISATLASIGTPSLFLHPAEAIHGDLGRIVKGDALIAVSNSGDTEEILALVPWLKRLGVPLVTLSGNPRSPLGQAADVHVDVGVRLEACPLGLAPTPRPRPRSRWATRSAWRCSSGAASPSTTSPCCTRRALGKKLQRVEDLMHTGDEIPRVRRPRR